MIDEFNNDVPYDFKNIQFYRQWSSSKSLWSTISSDNTGVPCYTFSSDGSSSTTSFTDMSLSVSNKIYSNVIKGYAKNNKQILNNNCFFGNDCYSNSFGNDCSSNTFGFSCSFNFLGSGCKDNVFMFGYRYNSLGVHCYNSIFGNNCYNNVFGDGCQIIRFGNNCTYNLFGDNCYINSLGSNCHNNTFGNLCYQNSFGSNCRINTFGNGCGYNYFGNECCSNSFGNECDFNSFRVSADNTSPLKDYVQYNHFDDGCSYNVIWNSNTTSSSVLLKNVNVNRGVVGTDSSYNMINIDVLNSEQEINVNQVDGIVSIGNILSIKYESLKTLRDKAQLIPGQQYHIIDYITTTTQENTRSVGHQFDIIVTALNESTLSEEAQAIQHSNDEYFGSSNLSAWKIWYCLDNDMNRFAWAGDEKIDEIEHKSYDSSKCTIKPELINGNAFITPFNFESCVWVDGDKDSNIPYDTHHDINELVYEWGYFTDENGVKQLCIYKSDADLYTAEGHPDYGDKYLYRGVVNVDGTEYDYWQKWDQQSEDIDINFSGDYVYATTQRIVSNPEAYSVTIETEDIYKPGKGVIYRMIDEWNNDCPYDFKNIMFKVYYDNDFGVYKVGVQDNSEWSYTFCMLDRYDNKAHDVSVKQYKYISDENLYYHTHDNRMLPYYDEYAIPADIVQGSYVLNANVFVTDTDICSVGEDYSYGTFYAFYNNSFGNGCYNNAFGNGCYNNAFGDNCVSNMFGYNCNRNMFGNGCVSNTFVSGCCANSFGNDCSNNKFGNDCSSNTFENICQNNVFGDNCINNTFGNRCPRNTFGNNCEDNTFGNNCYYIKFSSSSSATTKYNYYLHIRFGDGCQYILFKGAETASSTAQVQNYNFAQGLQGTSSAYIEIDGVRGRAYETKVAKNSKGEIKIYCEADLIA